MLPIDRTAKSALDSNLVNGNTSDAPVIKQSNDVVYNTIDEVNAKVDGLVGSSALSPYPPAFLSRQALINGNFDVWQRGTSFSSFGYTADRWGIGYDGSGQVGTTSQQSFTSGQGIVPNEPKFFLRRQVTTAASSQTYHQCNQYIEGVRSFAGQKVTISVWLKADASRTVGVNFIQYFGTGGTPSASVGNTAANFNVTTSWQKFTATFTIPSINGKTLGTNGDDSLRMAFNLPINTTFTVDIAQVQLNAGDQVLPFQPRSFAEELQLCRRYYNKSYAYGVAIASLLAQGTEWKAAINTTEFYEATVRFQQPMRVPPTITFYPYNSATVGKWNAALTTTEFTMTADLISESKFHASGTGLTANTQYIGHWTADSEL